MIQQREISSAPCAWDIRAVLLDVDGTLYHQSRLRYLMGLELSMLLFATLSVTSAYRTWRSLADFRRVREELRDLPHPKLGLAQIQYLEVARRIGVAPDDLEKNVSEWFLERPLKYLKICRRRGIEPFFAFLADRGIPIGVFSDYPVVDKVATLGLSRWISLTICAMDPEIDAFKPHPSGFLRACALWGLPPQQVLYVGDRPDVDAVGAAMVGMPCVIFCRKGVAIHDSTPPSAYLPCASFAELQHLLASII